MNRKEQSILTILKRSRPNAVLDIARYCRAELPAKGSALARATATAKELAIQGWSADEVRDFVDGLHPHASKR